MEHLLFILTIGLTLLACIAFNGQLKQLTGNESPQCKNTGDSPLVIVDVSTTCGCTAATYDKHPAKPGEPFWVRIKCNSINNKPVKAKIKGNVR